DAVLRIGTALHRNDDITAVVSNFSIEKPFLLIGPLVNQFVPRLRCAELMKEKLVIVNLRTEFVFLVRLVVTTVAKPAAVLFPRSVGKFDPIHQIWSILASPHVANFPLLPIGAGRGEAISH